MTLTVGSLFSGIGGIDLGLARAGMKVRWQVEIDPWCQKVLAKYWPDVERFADVKDFPPRGVEARSRLAVDLIAGGFPCQPVSFAGKGLAQDDPRWLWPEFARVIRELRPRYALMENVPGLLARGFGDVLGDLAESGYDAEWDCIPAAAVGAPHRRDRVWIIAYPASTGLLRAQQLEDDQERQRANPPKREGAAADPLAQGQVRGADALAHPDDGRRWTHYWLAEPNVGRVAHGVPARVDRLRGLGNSVVPQVVEWIGRRIVEAEAEAVGVSDLTVNKGSR